MTKKTAYTILLFLLIFFAYCGLRSHTVLAPFPHDEGLFLYGGQAWASGELPYRHFWDHKPPGTFFFHSIPLRLFPFSIFAVKIHECLWLAFSAVLLFSICRKQFTLAASIAASILYIFYTSAPYTVRTGGLTEESALFFIALSYWLMTRQKGHFLGNAFLAGLGIGIAIQFRQTFVFESLFLLGAAVHAVRQRNEKWFQIWKPFLLIAAGMILPEILVSFYFRSYGLWFDYIEASYLYNLFYVGPARPHRSLLDILAIQWNFILATGPYLFAPILALATLRWIPSSIRWMIPPLWATFLGDAFSISLSGEYYEHYYIQAAVTVNLLFALFLEGVINGVRSRWMNTANKTRFSRAAIYVLILLLIALIPSITGISRYVSDYRSILKERAEPESAYTFQHSAAEVARQLTTPDETILLIGRDPNSIYMLAQRYAGSRYYHFSPLWKEKLEGALTPRQEQDFFRDLDEKRPTLLFVDRRTAERLERENGFQRHVNEYMRSHYTPLENLLEKSPDEKWFWYGPNLTIWVRTDVVEKIRKIAS